MTSEFLPHTTYQYQSYSAVWWALQTVLCEHHAVCMCSTRRLAATRACCWHLAEQHCWTKCPMVSSRCSTFKYVYGQFSRNVGKRVFGICLYNDAYEMYVCLLIPSFLGFRTIIWPLWMITWHISGNSELFCYNKYKPWRFIDASL